MESMYFQLECREALRSTIFSLKSNSRCTESLHNAVWSPDRTHQHLHLGAVWGRDSAGSEVGVALHLAIVGYSRPYLSNGPKEQAT